jgi:uncharacterized membrane protein
MKTGLLQHTRLLSAAAAGVVLSFVLPGHWPLLVRILVSWNVSVMLFLTLIFFWMSRLSALQICAKYIEEDATAGVILVSVIFASLLSLVAIVALLSTLMKVTGVDRALHVTLAGFTVVDSWALVGTMFTLHYADEFYSVADNERPLLFPQTKMPVFWDFAYFSFTIAAACQTSDVATAGVGIRKTVLAHTLISFLFNVSILGFAINMTAGLFSAG